MGLRFGQESKHSSQEETFDDLGRTAGAIEESQSAHDVAGARDEKEETLQSTDLAGTIVFDDDISSGPTQETPGEEQGSEDGISLHEDIAADKNDGSDGDSNEEAEQRTSTGTEAAESIQDEDEDEDLLLDATEEDDVLSEQKENSTPPPVPDYDAPVPPPDDDYEDDDEDDDYLDDISIEYDDEDDDEEYDDLNEDHDDANHTDEEYQHTQHSRQKPDTRRVKSWGGGRRLRRSSSRHTAEGPTPGDISPRRFKWEVKTSSYSRAPPPNLVRATTTQIFKKEADVETSHGLSLREKVALFKRNAAKVGQVDRAEKTIHRGRSKAAMKPTQFTRARAATESALAKSSRVSQTREVSEILQFRIDAELSNSEEGKRLVDPGRGINLNNNQQIGKLGDAKREKAYKNLAVIATRTNGTFSMTNCGLDDSFATHLAVQLGKTTKDCALMELNLESNHISDAGYRALAAALKNAKSIKTVKLRHQLTAPSVPVQQLLVDALRQNKNIITLGVDLKPEFRRERDRLETRNRDLIRKTRQEMQEAVQREYEAMTRFY